MSHLIVIYDTSLIFKTKFQSLNVIILIIIWFSDIIKSVFGSVVVVAFQIAFRAEIHANDFFSFFKNHFWHQHIKTIQKVQTVLNFSKKKKNWNLVKRRFNRRAKQALNATKSHALFYWTIVLVIYKHMVCSFILIFYFFSRESIHLNN